MWFGLLGLTPKFEPSALSNPNQNFLGTEMFDEQSILRLQAQEGHFLLVGVRLTAVVLDKPLKTLWTGTNSLSEITTCFMMAMMHCNLSKKMVLNLDQNQKRVSSVRPLLWGPPWRLTRTNLP